MKKITIAVLFGGRSQEHDVSIMSAKSIIETLQKDQRYTIIPVGITRDGQWYAGDHIVHALEKKNYKHLTPVMIALNGSSELLFFKKEKIAQRIKIDLFFPWILGPHGEDGTLQGLLEVAGVAYVGCGVFASAVGFNKAFTKKVMTDAQIPQVPYYTFSKIEWGKDKKSIQKNILQKVGLPCFIKPASCGSSIGISKVKTRNRLTKAIKDALRFDDMIVVEMSVPHLKEIEVAVLGTPENLTVSLPGEVHYDGEFYDYHAKYVSKYWEIDIPPKLPRKTIEKIRTLAGAVFRAIHGVGLARIDFLMNSKSGAIYFNELNTVPAFRAFGCYATLMKKYGISYKKILDRLIQIAFAEHQKKKEKEMDFSL